MDALRNAVGSNLDRIGISQMAMAGEDCGLHGQRWAGEQQLQVEAAAWMSEQQALGLLSSDEDEAVGYERAEACAHLDAAEAQWEFEPLEEDKNESDLLNDLHQAKAAAKASELAQLGAKGRKKVFAAWDANGNGGLSLAEIDKGVVEEYPEYNHKPSLTRAYRAADRDGNGFITRREFKRLLHFISYFNGLWAQFESVDPEGDRRLTMAEFGEALLGLGRAVAPETQPPNRFVNLV